MTRSLKQLALLVADARIRVGAQERAMDTAELEPDDYDPSRHAAEVRRLSDLLDETERAVAGLRPLVRWPHDLGRETG